MLVFSCTTSWLDLCDRCKRSSRVRPPSVFCQQTYFPFCVILVATDMWRFCVQLLVTAAVVKFLPNVFIFIVVRCVVKVGLFAVILTGTRLSEFINTCLRDRWQDFSRQNYFDEHGIFMGVMWAGPLLVLGFTMLVSFEARTKQDQDNQKADEPYARRLAELPRPITCFNHAWKNVCPGAHPEQWSDMPFRVRHDRLGSERTLLVVNRW